MIFGFDGSLFGVEEKTLDNIREGFNNIDCTKLEKKVGEVTISKTDLLREIDVEIKNHYGYECDVVYTESRKTDWVDYSVDMCEQERERFPFFNRKPEERQPWIYHSSSFLSHTDRPLYNELDDVEIHVANVEYWDSRKPDFDGFLKSISGQCSKESHIFRAKFKFFEMYLKDYCRENSRHEYEFFWKDKKVVDGKEQIIEKKQMVSTSICEGWGIYINSGSNGENISCRMKT